MKELIVLLALASAGSGIQYDGLKVKYGKSESLADKEYFFTIPRTIVEAVSEGWNRTQRPEGPMPQLQMYCPPGRMVCPLYYRYSNSSDGFIAGLQIAAPVSAINSTLNPEQYFVKWNAPAVGKEPAQEFWTATQYYVSEDSLIAGAGPTRENGSTLQSNGVWIQGLDGTLMKVELSEPAINKTDFKKQNCVQNMGTHYYWNMTKQLGCNKNMLPWFPLVKKGKLLGVGFQTFGKKPVIDTNTTKTQKDWYENLPKKREAPLDAIPLAPECFLDLSMTYGRLSIHVYYISKPWEITCGPGDSVMPNAASLPKPATLVGLSLGLLYFLWSFA